MTDLERAALDWYDKRQAFLDAEAKPGAKDFRGLLNRCSDGEHNLAAAVRRYKESISLAQREGGLSEDQ